MIALLKAVHIIAFTIWCAGLILLPLMIEIQGRHAAVRGQAGFAQFRWSTHLAYTRVISPAAVIAVAAGTVLIFALELLAPWLLLKLLAVTGMVLAHTWLGHLVVQSGERRAPFRPASARLALVAVVPLMGLVLWLVLAKPGLEDLEGLLPALLQEPRGQEIPARLNPL